MKIINFNMKECRVCDLKENDICKILELKFDDYALKKQLENLGFLKHQNLMVVKISFGAKTYLVKVMGINYAIDKKIAEGVFVYAWNNFGG